MALTDNMRGALCMIGVTLCFTGGDAIAKVAAEDMPIFQFIFLRGCVAVPLLMLLVWRSGARLTGLAPRDRFLIVLRAVAESAGMICFFMALVRMPLANVTAILQAIPLTVTLAGALILKEPVGRRRFAAIGIGFVGMLLIVRPGAADFQPAAGFAVLAVFFVTIRDLAVRRIDKAVPTLLIAAVMAVIVTCVAGAASLVTPWAPVSAAQGGAVIIAGGMILLAYLFLVWSMRWGELGVVMPLRYASLIWALLLGWVIFGDWPAWPTWIGATLIVATGLFTLWRERSVNAATAPMR